MISIVACLLLFVGSSLSFAPPVGKTTGRKVMDSSVQLSSESRRDFVKSASFVLVPAILSAPVNAAGSEKVLVLGGTGFVGSRVVELLQQKGIQYVATSTNGRDGTVALDITSPDLKQDIEKLVKDCTVVISCVGVIGSPIDREVNAGTGIVASSAKQAGVQRFVYITVSPEVADFAEGIDFLKGYLEGKASSRKEILDNFGSNAVLIEPTVSNKTVSPIWYFNTSKSPSNPFRQFIYGGGSFELNPPRVASFYGSFIEGLLSSGPLRTVDRLLSPGIIKIALEPPVPVEGIAAAAVAGALGRTSSILDTYDKIKGAGNSL